MTRHNTSSHSSRYFRPEETRSNGWTGARSAKSRHGRHEVVPAADVIDNAFSGVRLACVVISPTHAEERVGGDFYDALRLSDGGIAIFVGDASGKGIRASSRATEVRYSLRAFLREDPDPARAVTRVNNILCQNLLLEQKVPFVSESMLFTTLTLAVIYPERREMHWVHAGGEFPLIFHMDGSTPTVAKYDGNLMLGVSSEQVYTSTITPLTRGDVVLLFTDGITEARQSGRFFGTEGVLRAVETFLSRKDP
jgi:serine phosphatase RsbU (regulator of sigma subunit)